MESEDAREAKTTQMAQAPGGNAESANVKQDSKQEVAACSRVWRIARRCKEWFFHLKCKISFSLVLGKTPSCRKPEV